MEDEPRSTLFDPDLDTPRRRPPSLTTEELAGCQRLVVNPFLAILCWVIVIAILRLAIQSHHLILSLTGILLLIVPFFLVQYHCLDCGATGWYARARRHTCAAVVARWGRGQIGRLRGPGIRAQLVAWVYILAAALVFYLVLLRVRR